jgi:hypothetical protein
MAMEKLWFSSKTKNIYLPLTIGAMLFSSVAIAGTASGVESSQKLDVLESQFPAVARHLISPPSSGVVRSAGTGSASSSTDPIAPSNGESGDEADQIFQTYIDHDGWRQVLSHYTAQANDGLTVFDYGALKKSAKDRHALTDYIESLAQQRPSQFTPQDAMAYWANLYNALTVKTVTDNYPIASILKIRSGLRAGPWRRELVKVEGKRLSLDNIEHDILRVQYDTPLVHYMLNCASVGCPNLKRTPWTGNTLDEDLAVAATHYINSNRGVRVNKGGLSVSSLYKWYEKDFGDADHVLSHLRQYADEDLRNHMKTRKKIIDYAYDWSLNAPRAGK